MNDLFWKKSSTFEELIILDICKQTKSKYGLDSLICLKNSIKFDLMPWFCSAFRRCFLFVPAFPIFLLLAMFFPFPLLALFSHFSLLSLVFLFFLFWPCPPIFHLLTLFSHFSLLGLVFPFFFAWPCFPIFPLLALSSHLSSFGLVFPYFLFWPVFPIFPYFGVQCYIEWSVGTFCQLMDPEIGSCYITNTKLLLFYCTKKWEGLVIEGWYLPCRPKSKNVKILWRY